jgi:alginate O-acetyltransferase complex protein AlgJ
VSRPEASRVRRRLRYVPLALLVVAGIVAGSVGYGVDRHQQQIADAPAPVVAETPDAGDPVAEACRPAVEPPAAEPWLDDAVASEATWAAHADEVGAPVLVGLDGWADWNDVQADNLSQAIGRSTLSNDEVGRWSSYLAVLDAELDSRGIPFYVVVTPMKWAVYPEKLPRWLQDLRGSGPIDQMMAAAGDLPLIDVRAPLREAAESDPVFSRVNSHWTSYGAAVAWEQITRCLAATSPALTGLSTVPYDGVEALPGSNEFAPYGVESSVDDATVPVFTEPLAEVTRTDAQGATSTLPGETPTQLAQLPVETVTAGAQSDLSAFVMRDSFGDALSVYMQQSFAHTWQHSNGIDSSSGAVAALLAQIEEVQPDVVILQFAGRYLALPPA